MTVIAWVGWLTEHQAPAGRDHKDSRLARMKAFAERATPFLISHSVGLPQMMNNHISKCFCREYKTEMHVALSLFPLFKYQQLQLAGMKKSCNRCYIQPVK